MTESNAKPEEQEKQMEEQLKRIQNAPSTNSAMAEIYHTEIKDSENETTAKNRINALIGGLESPGLVARIDASNNPGLEQTRKALISKLKQFNADGFFIDLDKMLAVYFPKSYKLNEIVEPKELIRKKTTFRVQAVRSEFDKDNNQEFGRTVIDESVTYDQPGQKMLNDIYDVESMLAMFSNKKRNTVFEETFTVRENIPFFNKNSENALETSVSVHTNRTSSTGTSNPPIGISNSPNTETSNPPKPGIATTETPAETANPVSSSTENQNTGTQEESNKSGTSIIESLDENTQESNTLQSMIRIGYQLVLQLAKSTQK